MKYAEKIDGRRKGRNRKQEEDLHLMQYYLIESERRAEVITADEDGRLTVANP